MSNCGTPKALSPVWHRPEARLASFVQDSSCQLRSFNCLADGSSPRQRERFDAAEQPAPGPPDLLRRDREVQVREAIEQLDDRHFDLEVRERRADAMMRAPTQREVGLRG